MGRKPTRWGNLPPGMRARPRGKKIFYYLDTGAKPRKEIPLGSEFVAAVAKWAELTSKPAPVMVGPITFVDALNGRGDCRGYRKDVLATKSAESQRGNEKELGFLLKFFGDPPAPLESTQPLHMKQYLRWRIGEAKRIEQAKNDKRREAGRPQIPIPDNYGHVRANRELALFSHVWTTPGRKG